MKKSALFFLIIITVTATTLFSQKTLSKDQIQAIDALFEDWDNEENPGGAIGVVKNGELIFSKGYGMASLQHKVPFAPNTVADIGSVAKQFTSFAIALLLEEGQLSLDDEIHDYFPDLPDYGHKVTIRHLVHHISGLREIYSAFALRGWSGGGIRQEDVQHLLMRQKELNFKPGDQYLYCNTSYALLGSIIEKITGMSFEAFFRKKVFGPLGMDHTYIMDELGEIFPHTADSYRPTSDGFAEVYDNSSMYGQGGFYSNIEDMSKWLANFQQPKVGNETVMRQIQERGILNNGDTLKYAFGLNIDTYRGVKRIAHSGSSAGFRTMMTWLPEYELGIILQTNRTDGTRGGTMEKVVDILLGDKLAPKEKKEEVDEPENDQTEHAPLSYSETELKKFAGKYYSPEIETVYTLYYDEKKQELMLKMLRNSPTRLSPRPEQDQFYSGGRDFDFERDDVGRVIGFRVSNGRVLGLKFFRVNLPSF
jgi:CubicO group peptidase (beta-lactamase class C family)